MPGLPRRFNFSQKCTVETAPSVLPEHPVAHCETQSALTPKTRHQGTRSRRSSILKRTASLPAATAGLITRTIARGEGDRRCAVNSREQNILPSILDLSESSRPRSPPEMTVPSSAAGAAGLTTFFTAIPACPSTRAILSSGIDGDFRLGRSRNLLTALTPCASVMAMYSGMMGGFGNSTESAFVYNVDAEHSQSSRLPGSDVSILQPGPGWFWFLERWKSCIDWLPITQNRPTNNQNRQPVQGQVSPWLTIFQVFAIMVLSVTLYRNMENLFG